MLAPQRLRSRPSAAAAATPEVPGPIRVPRSSGTPAYLRAPDSDGGGGKTAFPLFLQAATGSPARTKLVINQPGDAFEQEADRVADLAADEARAQPASAPRAGNDGEAHGATQRQAVDPAPPASPPTAPVTSHSGMPLAPAVRARVEPVLGTDLSHVRVHTDAAADTAARALDAKAFTHGADIWLRAGQRADDMELMAHEATHVAQQGAARKGAPNVQRKAELARTNDGEEVRGKMMRELAKAAGRDPDEADQEMPSGAPAQSAEPAEKPDPAELAAKRAELEPTAKPSVDRMAEQKPVVDQAAAAVKEEAAAPAEPLAEGKDGAAPAVKGGKAAQDPAAAAAALASQAFAMAEAEPLPDVQTPVVPPAIVAPVDAGGKALPSDPVGDAQVVGLADAAQHLREQGTALRARAAQQRANAATIRGNIGLVRSGIAQAEAGIAKSESHLAFRREVVGKAEAALGVSQQKAETVASEAPRFVEKSSEGSEQSSPMAAEAKDLASENASATPDDEEAAANSAEQGGKIDAVSSDIGTIDQAMSQTKTRAEGLVQEAEEAKQANTRTEAKIAESQDALGQTEARLDELRGKGGEAKRQIAGLAGGPAQVEAGAEAVDQQGLSLVQASFALEAQLNAAQASYMQGMQSVPAPTFEQAGGAPMLIQRKAEEGRYEDRVNLDLGGKVAKALPSWLTGEHPVDAAKRAEAAKKEESRRADEIKRIEAMAGGQFENLTAADKAGIALQLTSEHLFDSVGETNWPNFLGHMAQGLVDPRMALMGVVSGLSMTLSGFGNLLSGEQRSQDWLGNLLKSAADIATGITIILGAITALALAIIIIMIAAAIFSFGLLGPAAAAVIPFLWTVVSVVGGWTITAAWIALGLQELVFIKNLIDAATATSAKDLQNQADQMTDDAKNGGNMAMQIGMAKVMEAGGKKLGATKFGKAVVAEAKAIGEDIGIIKPKTGGGSTAVTEQVLLEPPPPLKEQITAKEQPPVKEQVTVKEPPPVEEQVTLKEPPPVKEQVTVKEPAPVEELPSGKKSEAVEKATEKKPSESAEVEPPAASKEVSNGARLAKEAGYPDPEPGYHWAEINGKLVYRRNPLRGEGPKLPERFYDAAGEPPGFKNVEKPVPVEGPELSNIAKRDVAEAAGHEYMKGQDCELLGSSKEPWRGSTEPGGPQGAGSTHPGKPQGLDGVYMKKSPPPKWIVGEAKWGESGYGTTKSGPQGSKPWSNARLDQAVGKKLADQIRYEGYEMWELRYDPITGTITKTKLW